MAWLVLSIGFLMMGTAAFNELGFKDAIFTPPPKPPSYEKADSYAVFYAGNSVTQFFDIFSQEYLDEKEVTAFIEEEFDLDMIGRKIVGPSRWDQLDSHKQHKIKSLLPNFLIKKYLIDMHKDYPFHSPQQISKKLLNNKVFLIKSDSEGKSIYWQFADKGNAPKIINIFLEKIYFAHDNHKIQDSDFNALLDYLRIEESTAENN